MQTIESVIILMNHVFVITAIVGDVSCISNQMSSIIFNNNEKKCVLNEYNECSVTVRQAGQCAWLLYAAIVSISSESASPVTYSFNSQKKRTPPYRKEFKMHTPHSTHAGTLVTSQHSPLVHTPTCTHSHAKCDHFYWNIVSVEWQIFQSNSSKCIVFLRNEIEPHNRTIAVARWEDVIDITSENVQFPSNSTRRLYCNMFTDH